MEAGVDLNAVTTEGRTAMQYAAEHGDLDVLLLLMENGGDIHAADSSYGWTPLYYAVWEGHLEVAQALIKAGADVNIAVADGTTLLHGAARTGNAVLVQTLVEAGVNVSAVTLDGRTALHYAGTEHINLDVVEALLVAGLDAIALSYEGCTVLYYAAYFCDLDVMQRLVQAGADLRAVDNNGNNVLHNAACGPHVEVVEALIAAGVDTRAVNERGWTPFYCAVTNGSGHVVDAFFNNGLDLNEPLEGGCTILHQAIWSSATVEAVETLLKRGASVNAPDQDGKTALHHSPACYDPEISKVLLKGGADVNAVCNAGKTPLHYAALWNARVVTLLIEFGADLNSADNEGKTAVHVATEGVRIDALKLLIDAGADVHAVDKLGWTALHHAAHYARSELVSLLLESGANLFAKADAGQTPLAACLQWPADIYSLVWVVEVAYILISNVCVVGASKAGKTSLVKSITSMSSTLVNKQDRTIGVDFFHLAFTEETDAAIRNHAITFWDFAGQDESHVAHSLFFSRRTLYLICVDIAAFSEVVKCSRKCDDGDEAEAAIDMFVREHVWRWFRMIFTRQPDAEFVVISTKADAIENESAVQLSELENELFKVLQEYKAAFQNEMQREMDVLHGQGGNDTKDEAVMERVAQLQSLLTQLDQSLPSSWTPLNVCDRSSIEHARLSVQSVVIESGRSFLMPIKYSRVLSSIKEMRKEKPKQFIKDRIKQTFVPLPQLQQALVQTVEGLTPDECETILEILHDLGDVLWFARDGLAVLGDTLILSADLLIDLIRQIVCHDPAKNPSSTSSLDNQPLEEMQQSGKVAHDLLRSFSLWKRLDYPDQMLRIKQLLQHFRLAFPAGNCEMQADSDLIVPAYWRVRQHHLELSLLEPLTNKLNGREVSMLTHFHWEYDFHHELVETAFEQLAVESYAVFDEREIHGHCIESISNDDFAIRIALGTRGRDNQRRQVILLEVVAVDCDLAADFLQLLYEATENVLGAYPGLYARWSAVVNGHRNRIDEAVQKLRAATPSMLNVLQHRYSWLPPNVVSWYHRSGNPKTARARPATNLELTKIASMYNRQKSMTVKMEKMLTKLDNTKETMVNLHAGAGNHRDLPALWVAERVLKPKPKLIVWILSEISGRCFHQPIEIEVSSQFLATHGELLQTGLSLFANALPDDIPMVLPLVKELATGAV
ncbi:hypothetical protein Poli38472_014687 [Pythium oligandrum]|uniref:Non-specific serine/threonine protein kinase n=1 Tax=Pythium oligandrum TaxID=41045 RepID=A0A8K1CIF0_PYTOL|nr:hypothetical protein Poli38472_014687 [Pythium oligandrum]|eukprot:TMW63982.1 hypothetical protein Poli38472_014687 [Pythium oligandrum]